MRCNGLSAAVVPKTAATATRSVLIGNGFVGRAGGAAGIFWRLRLFLQGLSKPRRMRETAAHKHTHDNVTCNSLSIGTIFTLNFVDMLSADSMFCHRGLEL